MIRPGIRRLFRLAVRRSDLAERDLDDELELHLALRVERLIREGRSPAAARAEAMRRFGSITDARRTLRAASRRRETRMQFREWRDARAHDLRHALRQLALAPGFALVAVLTLALGIGGTSAVFSVVRAVLIEPLPYEQPHQLVRLYQVDVDEPAANLFVTGPHFLEYRDRVAAYQSLGALYTYAETGANLTVGDRAERVRLLRVTEGYFSVLRVQPTIGRTFTRDEETGALVAILGERLWRRLDDDQARLGGTIELDGRSFTVIGMMPDGLRDPIAGAVDVWIPEDLTTSAARFHGNHYLTVIGRLAPGVGMSRAREEMQAMDRVLAERWPDVAGDGAFRVVSLHDDLVAGARPALVLLMGAIGLVLLLACVNVANLLMVRSLGRVREMAVRSSLGASGRRIAGQLLTEALLLAAIGGVAGLGVAIVGLDVLLALGRDALPQTVEVRLDAQVLAFAAAITLVTGLVFGVVPAVRLARTSPATLLRESSRGSSAGLRFARVRGVLVIGQVALALMLLMGATVLTTSMFRLAGVDLGLRTDGMLTFELSLPAGRYDAAARASFHRRATERLASIPGVSAAAAVTSLPATGTFYQWGTRALDGPTAGAVNRMIPAEQRVVEGGYFGAFEIQLLEGRVFDDRDVAGAPEVAVVSRGLADRLFAGTSALGRRIRMGGVDREIVGIVGDVALDAEGQPAFHVYHPHAQFASRTWNLTYVVAAGRSARALVPEVRREIAALDPLLVLHRPVTLEDVLGRGRSQRQFAAVLSAVFAGLALTLAVLGLYGVLAYVVTRRRHEIAIRLALGARAWRVGGMIIGHGLLLTAFGVMLGAAGTLASGQVLASLVFRTAPTDGSILGLVIAFLTIVSALAALVPAYRAMRVPPTIAMADL